MRTKNTVNQKLESFPSVYLTLTSVIVSLSAGNLLIIVHETIFDSPSTEIFVDVLLKILIIISSSISILLYWHEYAMGSVYFR